MNSSTATAQSPLLADRRKPFEWTPDKLNALKVILAMLVVTVSVVMWSLMTPSPAFQQADRGEYTVVKDFGDGSRILRAANGELLADNTTPGFLNSLTGSVHAMKYICYFLRTWFIIGFILAALEFYGAKQNGRPVRWLRVMILASGPCAFVFIRSTVSSGVFWLRWFSGL